MDAPIISHTILRRMGSVEVFSLSHKRIMLQMDVKCAQNMNTKATQNKHVRMVMPTRTIPKLTKKKRLDTNLIVSSPVKELYQGRP